MLRHHIKTLVEYFRVTRFNVTTSDHKSHDISLIDQTYGNNVSPSMSNQNVNVMTSDQSSLDSENSPMLRHRINFVTLVMTLVEDCRTTRYDVATSYIRPVEAMSQHQRVINMSMSQHHIKAAWIVKTV